VATAADGEALVGLVHDLMSKAGLEVRAQAKEISGRYVTIELDGQDAAHLVGKQGEVLNATQYLVNIIAGRRFNNGVRATLDGNNYRRRREARLEAMATELAKQVRARGEEAVLDALPAFERRVVHKVLSTLDGITTYSEGEEPNRRVVIAPAD
jgi:spoIIIJ-associated protein